MKKRREYSRRHPAKKQYSSLIEREERFLDQMREAKMQVNQIDCHSDGMMRSAEPLT